MGKNKKRKKQDDDMIDKFLKRKEEEIRNIEMASNKKKHKVTIRKIEDSKRIEEEENEILKKLKHSDLNLKEVSEKSNFKKKKFLMDSKHRKNLINPKIAEYIIKQKNILCINQKLYMYSIELGYYQEIETHDLQVMVCDMILKQYGEFIRSSDIDAICRFIKINPYIQIRNDNLDKNTNMINCKNCVIDFKKNKIKLSRHDKKYYFLNSINANFREDFNYEKFKGSNFYKFLDSVTKGDRHLKRLIQEITGYSISSLNNAKKFFVLYGKSNSGKSVYLDLLSFLCGKENISNIPLQSLSDERYTGELFGKVLNIYNELPDRVLKETGTIKSLVSECDKTICKPVYKNPFSFRNRATIIFATNNLPTVENNAGQDNDAFFNRIIIVPFINSISEDKQDKELIKKLKKESDFIFTWAIEGLERYIGNQYKFSKCEKSEKILKKYKNRESLVEKFIEERLIFATDKYVFKCDLMKEFEQFCEEQGKNQVSSKEKENLKNIIINKYDINYTKIHRGTENKYGFKGIEIK
ncbi:DNA primase family protein [Clostridium saccharobutylicum]|uniref:SF3 helicase domain-containing protein n=1 Tax=Clostridium saccharobutylicum TaxID=169679 RepID=A0A1S8N421_CLOSA|nr:DNA primase family protein [Clostridium saccharobutylicum]OOM11153.1 hypothetical protein CLOSAC_26960 [Clostridium saccharobutylicum]